jgi:hypothetical protein
MVVISVALGDVSQRLIKGYLTGFVYNFLGNCFFWHTLSLLRLRLSRLVEFESWAWNEPAPRMGLIQCPVGLDDNPSVARMF